MCKQGYTLLSKRLTSLFSSSTQNRIVLPRPLFPSQTSLPPLMLMIYFGKMSKDDMKIVSAILCVINVSKRKEKKWGRIFPPTEIFYYFYCPLLRLPRHIHLLLIIINIIIYQYFDLNKSLKRFKV